MRIPGVLAILALAVGGAMGCATRSTTTDGDRQVEDQARKANAVAVEKVEAARAGSVKGSENWTLLGLALDALEDVERGTAQLQAVHGPPKEPKIYTKANMDAAIAQSAKDHAGTPWGTIALGAASAAAGIAGTMLGMPWLSGIFPALAGKWKAVADTGVQIITSLRREAEKPGGLTPKKLLETAVEYAASAPKGVDAYMKTAATAFEEKLGFKPAVKLHEEAHAAAAPAPAVAPAPAH